MSALKDFARKEFDAGMLLAFTRASVRFSRVKAALCPACQHPPHPYGVWSNGVCGLPVLTYDDRVITICACKDDGTSVGYRKPAGKP